jgi:hypothetical protein
MWRGIFFQIGKEAPKYIMAAIADGRKKSK